MTKKTFVFTALLFLSMGVTHKAHAQLAYDRVLIPIAVDKAPGMLGSVWTSETWIYNSNSFAIDLRLKPNCIPLCILPPLQAKDSVAFHANEPAENPGIVLSVQQPSENVWFFSRVYDETRQADTFGTEIAVVREQQFYNRPFYLVRVPTAGRFRVLLRIYELDDVSNPVVTLRASDGFSGGRDFGSIDLPLNFPATAPSVLGTSKPSFASVQNVALVFPSIIDTAGRPVAEWFNLEIKPKTPGQKIWGFATVTHNDTQHVTTIMPN